MSMQTPLLDDFALLLKTITQTDIDFTRANSMPLGEHDMLLGIALGYALDGLSEAARAFVLMSNLTTQLHHIVNGTIKLPVQTDLDMLARTVEIRIEMCAQLMSLGIHKICLERRISLQDGATVGIVMHEGQFQAVVISDEEPAVEDSDEDDPDNEEGDAEVVFTPEKPIKPTVN